MSWLQMLIHACGSLEMNGTIDAISDTSTALIGDILGPKQQRGGTIRQTRGKARRTGAHRAHQAHQKIGIVLPSVIELHFKWNFAELNFKRNPAVRGWPAAVLF